MGKYSKQKAGCSYLFINLPELINIPVMKNKSLSRRRFLHLSSAFGALALIPGSLFRKAQAQTLSATSEIAVVRSMNYYQAAVESVKAIGGINSFVKKGSKVGLLINGGFSNQGTFTNPDIAFAVLKMCIDAGAGEIMLIRDGQDEYWKRSAYYESHRELLEKCTRSAGNAMVKVERGLILKEAEMIREIFELDALINIPISKHHDGAFLTGCLKNMMGLCTRSSNVLFHSITGRAPADNQRLRQCIADINTVRLPDLCIVDSTSFIINNGPHGPGEIREEHKVLAGTDPVALDAYCANLLGLEPGMASSTDHAAALGLGIADLSKINIKEIELT
jgi:uncharacterized protein (DUF362 family)